MLDYLEKSRSSGESRYFTHARHIFGDENFEATLTLAIYPRAVELHHNYTQNIGHKSQCVNTVGDHRKIFVSMEQSSSLCPVPSSALVAHCTRKASGPGHAETVQTTCQRKRSENATGHICNSLLVALDGSEVCVCQNFARERKSQPVATVAYSRRV